MIWLILRIQGYDLSDRTILAFKVFVRQYDWMGNERIIMENPTISWYNGNPLECDIIHQVG